jgi:hypothetical protein
VCEWLSGRPDRFTLLKTFAGNICTRGWVVTFDQKQLKNVENFIYLGSIITNGVRCTREIKPLIAVAKATVNKKEAFHQQVGHKFKGRY